MNKELLKLEAKPATRPPACSRQECSRRLSLMSRREAISTLTYLCKISEADFAQQLAIKNPQWNLEISNSTVVKKRRISLSQKLSLNGKGH